MILCAEFTCAFINLCVHSSTTLASPMRTVVHGSTVCFYSFNFFASIKTSGVRILSSLQCFSNKKICFIQPLHTLTLGFFNIFVAIPLTANYYVSAIKKKIFHVSSPTRWFLNRFSFVLRPNPFWSCHLVHYGGQATPRSLVVLTMHTPGCATSVTAACSRLSACTNLSNQITKSFS